MRRALYGVAHLIAYGLFPLSLLACSTPSSENAGTAGALASAGPGGQGSSGGSGGLSSAADSGGPAALSGSQGESGSAALAGPATGGSSGSSAAAGSSIAGGSNTLGGVAGAPGTTSGPAGGGSGAGGGSTNAGKGGAASAAPSDEPCGESSVGAGDTTKMIALGGTMRSFLIHAPPSYDGKKRVPVVFDFHGLTGTSSQQKNLSRWADVGDDKGFMVVYPQGLGNAWNAGLCCTDETDDVAFVRAIIETLKSEACVDTNRVFASGCSNGGGMSYRLACEAADVITGIAPVDFDCVLGSNCSQCKPSRPVSVVQFRGTNDQLVNYEGSGAFAGAKKNLATWGELNQCTGSPMGLEQRSQCESFPTCGSGANTILCTVQNGTHCGSYRSFMIPEVAWELLQDKSLP